MKRIIAFSILVGLLFGAYYYFHSEVKQANDTVHYSALGDSIAEGLSATENHGYTYLLDRYYTGLYKTVDYNNFAESGDTSGDLLNKLKTADKVIEAVKKADVITISIGGNDILRGVDGLVQGNFFGFDDRIKTFSENWESINATIKGLNSKAEIYVMDLYNPINIGDYYHGVQCDQEKWQIIENHIRDLNGIITTNTLQKKYKYKVANIYLAFQQYSRQGKVLTNFEKNLDPHPTDVGHELIFEQHLLLIPKVK